MVRGWGGRAGGDVEGVVGDGDDGAQSADADDDVQRSVQKHVSGCLDREGGR